MPVDTHQVTSSFNGMEFWYNVSKLLKLSPWGRTFGIQLTKGQNHEFISHCNNCWKKWHDEVEKICKHNDIRFDSPLLKCLPPDQACATGFCKSNTGARHSTGVCSAYGHIVTWISFANLQPGILTAVMDFNSGTYPADDALHIAFGIFLLKGNLSCIYRWVQICNSFVSSIALCKLVWSLAKSHIHFQWYPHSLNPFGQELGGDSFHRPPL